MQKSNCLPLYLRQAVIYAQYKATNIVVLLPFDGIWGILN